MTFNLLSQLTERSTNKEDEDEGSPVDDIGVEIDDESDANFDVEEGEGDGLRLNSSDDDESEWLPQAFRSGPRWCGSNLQQKGLYRSWGRWLSKVTPSLSKLTGLC
ncbi:hypothetical protein PoB_001534300 [Plakobranchus ocellatus]|uniref:Uncharacterized protein n=1 Tax=Plakobranchus ocellatus TaxID=259542 RepID=A0AAV3Z2W1_9GAST|nr:hypothetical protein PoB_001534300 [Plakobranchus ocellatus]